MATASRWRAWLGPWLIGLGVTLAISVGAHLLFNPEEWWNGLIVFGGLALWVAWDSSRTRIQDYRTQMANEPLMLFFICSFFWIVVFPWYLIVRIGIARGLVPRKRGISRQVRP